MSGHAVPKADVILCLWEVKMLGCSHGAQACMLQVSRHKPVSRMPGKQRTGPSPQPSVLFKGPQCSSSIVYETLLFSWTSCYRQSKHILYLEAKCIFKSLAPNLHHREEKPISTKGRIRDQIGETLVCDYHQRD